MSGSRRSSFEHARLFLLWAWSREAIWWGEVRRCLSCSVSSCQSVSSIWRPSWAAWKWLLSRSAVLALMLVLKRSKMLLTTWMHGRTYVLLVWELSMSTKHLRAKMLTRQELRPLKSSVLELPFASILSPREASRLCKLRVVLSSFCLLAMSNSPTYW